MRRTSRAGIGCPAGERITPVAVTACPAADWPGEMEWVWTSGLPIAGTMIVAALVAAAVVV